MPNQVNSDHLLSLIKIASQRDESISKVGDFGISWAHFLIYLGFLQLTHCYMKNRLVNAHLSGGACPLISLIRSPIRDGRSSFKDGMHSISINGLTHFFNIWAVSV